MHYRRRPLPHPPLAFTCFANHVDHTYPHAVSPARQTARFREPVEGWDVLHIVPVKRTTPQPTTTIALLQVTLSLKRSTVFDSDGLLVPSNGIAKHVLDCHRRASPCADLTAYCCAELGCVWSSSFVQGPWLGILV